jgi:hypothetical protein
VYRNFDLHGSIPATVSQWTNLKTFNVGRCNFTGPLPSALPFASLTLCAVIAGGHGSPFAILNKFSCPWPAGAKDACNLYDDDCKGTTPPTPPTPAPTPAPAYLCDASTGTCKLDATGTQQQAHCISTCKAPTYYSCNTTLGQCYEDPQGNQTLSECSPAAGGSCKCIAPHNCGQFNKTHPISACGKVLDACNVCDICCKPWWAKDQLSCDTCFKTPAPNGCGGK